MIWRMPHHARGILDGIQLQPPCFYTLWRCCSQWVANIHPMLLYTRHHHRRKFALSNFACRLIVGVGGRDLPTPMSCDALHFKVLVL